MTELVLELYSQEIPARMQRAAAVSLREAASDLLKKEGAGGADIRSYVTPMRLVLHIDGLPRRIETGGGERKGPAISAPDAAVEGFMRSVGVESRDDLEVREVKGREFFFHTSGKEGRDTSDILQEIIPQAISSVPWPKTMRWGDHETRWVRPLQSIACVFDGEVLPIKYGHLSSGNASRGHNFMSNGQFSFLSFEEYKDDLARRHVALSLDERLKDVRRQAASVAANVAPGAKPVASDALYEEIAGLVEKPYALLGSIDEEFMELPAEVLISSIRTHQKYICIEGEDGKLLPHFIVVTHLSDDDESKREELHNTIIKGNERVLRARLFDALFFWQQDRKINLAKRREQLSRISFHEKLGTMQDKSERIAALAKLLALWIPATSLEMAERAALMCKADLTTEMVGEFPELQGLMGYHYAKLAGEDEQIYEAMREQYLPAREGDACPHLPVSVAIAIADKIDSLAGMFIIGQQPTGSKDPFALRRAALGVLRIIITHNLHIPLRMLCEHAVKAYPTVLFKDSVDDTQEEAGTPIIGKVAKKLTAGRTRQNAVIDDILSFFATRLKVLMKQGDIRNDLITAVFEGTDEDDVIRVLQRAQALQNFMQTQEGGNLLTAYARACNILKKEEKKDDTTYAGNISKNLLEQEEERQLTAHLAEIRTPIKRLIKEAQDEEAMRILSSLRPYVDNFFDNVQVNCDNGDIRRNRLRILASLRELMDNVADFSVVES